MQQTLKNYAEINGGVRSAPRKITVRKNDQRINPVLVTDVKIEGAPSEEGFAPDSEERLAEFGSHVSKPEFKQINPKNPFSKEKIVEHPIFRKAEVHLEPKGPSLRYQVLESSIPKGMDKLRRDQELVNPFTTETQPQLQATKQMRALRKMPERREAMTPDQPAFQAHYTFKPLRTRVPQNQSNLYGWNVNGTAEPDVRMYHNVQFGRQNFNELRMKKRKQQQDAWKARQDVEKQRVEQILRTVLSVKHSA